MERRVATRVAAFLVIALAFWLTLPAVRGPVSARVDSREAVASVGEARTVDPATYLTTSVTNVWVEGEGATVSESEGLENLAPRTTTQTRILLVACLATVVLVVAMGTRALVVSAGHGRGPNPC